MPRRLLLFSMIFSVISKYITGEIEQCWCLTHSRDSPNTYQFCDILAKHCGWRVIMPDFLHGDYATAALMGDIPKLLKWIEKVGTTEVVSVNKRIYRKYFINFEIWI